MFIRFVISGMNEETGCSRGLFAAAYALRNSGSLDTFSQDRLQVALHWFEDNLPLPRKSEIDSRAIFWFKSNAQDLVGHVWDLIQIIEDNGSFAEIVKTSQPGYIVYEDPYQVGAIPFRDTLKK